MQMTSRGQAAGLSARPVEIAAAVAMLVGCYIHYWGGYHLGVQNGFTWGNDDAFITFRYAQNLIEAGVLSFNLTDDPPVEGFSNPLQLVLSAGLLPIFGKEGLYPAMAALGAAAAAGSVLVLANILRQAQLSPISVAVGAWCLAAAPQLWMHGTSGLETPFVFLCQLLLLGELLRADRGEAMRPARVILICILLTGLRTDGFVLPVIALGWSALQGHWRLAFTITISCGASFLALMLARYGYFGELMPNTFYAKVSGPLLARLEEAYLILRSLLKRSGLIVCFVAMAILALRYMQDVTRRRRSYRQTEPTLFLCTGLIAYYFMIGGDFYRERFLLLLFPIGIIVALQLTEAYGRRVIIGVGFAIVVGQLSSLTLDRRFDFNFSTPKQDLYVTLGKYLKQHAPRATLATGAAGKVPFFSELETIDMLGLNNKHIARTEPRGSKPGHNKFDHVYVFSQRPEIICSHMMQSGSLFYGITREAYQKNGYALFLGLGRTIEGRVIVTEITDPGGVIDIDQFTAGLQFGCVRRT